MQAWFYIALRGRPFAAVTSRAHRLLLANIATTAAGVVTYILLCGPISLTPSTANAVAGPIIAAVLVHGMLFDGPPRSPEHPGRERLITVSIVAVVSTALHGLLTALSHQERRTTAAPTEWVTSACLNAIGIGVILHVGIGRRRPFADRRDAPSEVPAL